MRRLTSAVTTALLLTASADSVTRAQSPSPRPVASAPQPPAPIDPMISARAPRHLLRNAQDYLGYGEFSRALQLLREAETRISELTPAEQEALRKGLEQARQGLRAGAQPTAVGSRGPIRRPSAIGQPAGPPPGALALAEPSSSPPARVSPDGLVLTAAQAHVPAPVAPPPIELSEPGVVTTSASPSDIQSADSIPPLPIPANLPALPDSSTGSADQPLTDPGAQTAGAVLPPVPLPVESPPLPAEPAPIPVEASPGLPVAPAPSAEPNTSPAPIAVPPLPEQPAQTAANPPGPQPGANSTPPPPPLSPAPAALPANPQAEPAPVALPEETSEPSRFPSTAPLLVRVPARQPDRPAQQPPPGPEPLPPLPPPADQVVTEPAPEAFPGPVPTQEPSQIATDSTARTDLLPSRLNSELQREVEEIARRQIEERSQRQPEPLRSPFSSSSSGTGNDLSASAIELSRPPSPTESRPIEAIPVPEEYETLEPRRFDPSRKYWAAAATCHGILYFQDPVLERYGVSTEQRLGKIGRFLSYPLDDPTQSTQRNQIAQPFVSAARFAAQIATFPYKVLVDTPGEAEYDLGYYRPGDKVPTDVLYLPHSGVGPPLHGKHY